LIIAYAKRNMNDLPVSAFPLLLALTAPERTGEFGLKQWDLLIRQARRTRLLARIAVTTLELDRDTPLPAPVQDVLRAAVNTANDNQRMIKWEINRIRRALSDVGSPVVLLKGAAYVAAELPPAKGRIAGDIDIMVPFSRLADVEAALEAHGWRTIKFLDYDQRYYRNWMHELPPLRHEDRKTVIDVHHTILPQTSRLKPDPDKLWEKTRDLKGSGMKVLGPQDMVLHSAAHLFHDGDLGIAIRDLVDIADLTRCFGHDPEFWETIVERGTELQLQRPLYYAFRYGRSLLHLDIPQSIERDLAHAMPPRLFVNIMDRSIPRVLLPDHPDKPSNERKRAAMLLYLRSHWLRMQPWLLFWQLLRKGLVRLAMTLFLWHENQEKRANQRG
jgi:hypothetical protein